MKRREIVVGGVYVCGVSWRRVVSIVEVNGRRALVYSTGSDRNRACLVSTFARWAERFHSESARRA